MSNGLGRGLSSLISEKPGAVAGAVAVEEVQANAQTKPIQLLAPASWQPRQHFIESELEELADSIRQNGVLQPIIARKTRQTGRPALEIIAGERRWRASNLAGLKEVPVIVMDVDDKKALEIALVENIQRQNLTPLEEANGYKRLVEEFQYTQETLADVLGKSRSQVSNAIRLLSLPGEVKEYVERDALSAGHARALLAADKKQAVDIAKEVVAKQLNVRQTEQLVKKGLAIPRTKRSASAKPQEVQQLELLLGQVLALPVAIQPHKNKGKVTISYNSLEELDALVKRLQGAA